MKSIVLVDILSVPLFCSPNVLLDAELRAVVADFGFVSALPETVGLILCHGECMGATMSAGTLDLEFCLPSVGNQLAL